MKPVIYNREVERQGVLHRAHHIGYERVFNDLHTALFDLPVLDDDVALCENTHYIVDIYDGDRYIDKFRITGQPQECVTEAGAVYRYACDHVIAFLADCRIDGYLEIGGTGVSTRQVIETLLARQQEEWGFTRWKLGRCDFDFDFQYGFENTDVLNALYSVPKCFLESYHFTFDTTAFPWTINLIRGTEEANCAIQYRRNLQWIKRTKDVTSLCTRLYCLGSGEGVNQTNIKRLTGGVNYIESQTKSKHGVIAKHLIDRSISDDALLYAKGKALLAEIDEPMYSYVVGGLDLHRKTGLDFDLMDEGKVVRVQDEDAKIDFIKPILSVRKDDVELDPLGIEITIANRTEDVASTIENLSARAAITAQYSQGATNLFPMQVTDNADPSHPAILKFFVPESCAKINAVKLSFSLSAFRAYETGAQAGGGEIRLTEEGGGSERTSSSGGGTTVTASERVITSDMFTSGPVSGREGSAVDFTTLMYSTAGTADIELTTGAASGSTGAATGNTGTPIGTASGAAMTETGTGGPTTTDSASAGVTVNTYTAYTSSSSPGTDSAGTHSHTVSSHTHSIDGHRHTLGTSDSYTGYYYLNNTGSSSPSTGSSGSHSHTVNSHSHEMTHTHTATGGSHTHPIEQHNHGMNHYHDIGSHTHSLGSHTHSIPDHRHGIDHVHKGVVSFTIPELSIEIPSHVHSVQIPAHSHSFTISDHTHDIVYGIYEGGIASSISISVDGSEIPQDRLLDENGYPVAELDVVGYMATDDDGRITRGTWHEVQLTPDSLTRIEAFLFVQTFVRSYSGGEY